MLLLLGCAPVYIPFDTTDDDTGGTGGTTGDPRFGTGADGPLVVEGSVSLDDWVSDGRSSPDAVAYRVTTISGKTLEIAESPSGLAAGDEVLIIDLQGTDTTPNRLGAWQFATLDVVTSSLTLTEDVAPFADPAYHVIVVQRVPNYTDVTLAPMSLLTTGGWDGQGGGVLAFRASGTVALQVGAALTVAGLGYRGGDTGGWYNADGYQGESWGGPGDGGNDDYGYNQNTGEWVANEGGGGALVTGAGGEYAGGATPGEAWYESAYAPEAGETYGDAELGALFFGSGGGGVWNDGGADAGPGGDGGGILYVSAARLEAEAGATVTATGESTNSWSQGNWSYGAGGGAGGSIWLSVGDLSHPTPSIDASGGFGESAPERAGGDGGVGRVRVDCDTFDGAPCSIEALAGVSVPEVGAVGAP